MDLAFRERSVDAERKRRRDLRSLEPRDGPFAIRNLWAPSVFPLQSLEPLEKPTWDEKFPGAYSERRGVYTTCSLTRFQILLGEFFKARWIFSGRMMQRCTR
jgi:hypothetical protein